MINSMTGYGDAQLVHEGVTYAVEIRSLNHRYYKATIKLSEHLQYLEADVDKQLRQRAQRGSITYVLRTRNCSASATYEINRAALEHYVVQLGAIAATGGSVAPLDVTALVTLPGVCQPRDQDESAKVRDAGLVRKLTDAALDKLVVMRQREGEALSQDLLKHCDHIRQLVRRVAQNAPSVVQEYHRKLGERVNVLLAEAKLQVDQASLLREVAVYADRSDISEEIARLSAHLDQFAEFCNGNENAGRKLDFMAQEMLREANTIGSKSNNAQIARDVVEIKGAIDRLKEQVQNVE
jgi:uncharacterized protein (TIGR00255 family)